MMRSRGGGLRSLALAKARTAEPGSGPCSVWIAACAANGESAMCSAVPGATAMKPGSTGVLWQPTPAPSDRAGPLTSFWQQEWPPGSGQQA